MRITVSTNRRLFLVTTTPGFLLLYSSLVLLGSFSINNLVTCQEVQLSGTKVESSTSGQVEGKKFTNVTSSASTIKRSIFDESQHAQAHQSQSAVAAGFLLADSTDLKLNLSDPLDRNLSQILDRDGPDMRPSRDYNDFKDITIDITKRAWSLLHDHVSIAVREQIDLAWPTMERLLVEAKTSNKCRNSVRVLLDGAKRFDSWAIRILNSWGHFPMSGIYEGTYGSVGSFHTCVDVEENKLIGHAHYCSVTFRPLMPSQKDYELIVRPEAKELRQMFEKLRQQRQSLNGTTGEREDYRSSSNDAFTDILEHAQYHHFLHYKWGTCWPISCSPFDVRRVAKLFGRKSILLNGPVKCYSKFENDYEQPDEMDVMMQEEKLNEQKQANNHDTNANFRDTSILVSGNSATTFSNATISNKRKHEVKKLVISVWDKNNGIFIWKPHHTKAHKVAITVILVVSIFLALMTTIDICLVRMPLLWQKFILCLKGEPLNNRKQVTFDNRHRGLSSSAMYERKKNNFSMCSSGAAGGELELSRGGAPGAHPIRPGFSMVPSCDGAPPLPPSAFHHIEDDNRQNKNKNNNYDHENDDDDDDDDEVNINVLPSRGFLMSIVDDCSLITNLESFFRVSEGQMKNDILCLNGIRCITMIWIIMTHTMMYNDWSAFARTRAIEIALNSLLSQPLFNGSYLVDTFFLMSGLLSAFTAFKHCQGAREKFNSFAFIFGRWLRLTPQIFFVSMIYIMFPTLSYGPHWFPIVGEYSENCVKNWWINVLHIQAFYKKEEMCNFVTWWISIDFFYHFFALAVIWIILLVGHKFGSLSMALIIGFSVLWQSVRHYDLALPPNIFSTIPQTGAMWTTMTLDFFWTPYTHSIPFFFGFYIGYLMSLKQKLIQRWLNTRRALIGWTLAVGLLVGQSYATYWWVTGKAEYSRLVSTLYFGASSLVWSGSICWIIIACQHGYGGFVNQVLSWKVFIVLGKSSYIIYLTHFMILFIFFGNQNIFLEPSTINMIYMIFGNILLSTLLGIIFCAFYEIPWLKMQRRLMKYV